MCQSKRILVLFLLVESFLLGSQANGKGLGLSGEWQTIDHKINKPSSILRIWKSDSDGKYYGKIVKVYNLPSRATLDRCQHCPGKLRDHLILGLTMLFGFTDIGHGKYHDGRILDPESGRIYQCMMWLDKNERALHVRGYVGFPWLGHMDVWFRVPIGKRKE